MMMGNREDTSSHKSDDGSYEYEYDIFLSFRGEDTRHSFTGSLYHALSRKGLKIFIDDDGLKGGDEIKRSLVNAIQKSRISIVVLSENYASSSWCLDELVEIVECMKSEKQLVWPIFYKVAPSDVRHQRNTYAEAMAQHEEKFGEGSDRVQKWRSVLSQVAGLSGSHYHTGYEYQFIQEIVRKASTKLKPEQLDVGEHIIGHQSLIEEVKPLLEIESNQTVCMFGIHGPGGIGKTTLAKALYNSIANRFECAVFLESVREISNSYMGLVHLQEAILSKLFEGENIKLGNASEGVTRLKGILQHRRVLLVLDDVDSEDQLEKLAGQRNWFASGSRILITTRDTHVLDFHEVEKRYEMKELRYFEALQLFSLKAFKMNQPAKDFINVSNRVVRYAGGIPLVLNIIGSHLAKKSVQECEGALEQYERIPERNIQHILKISYDSLEDSARNIFLDIACFFKGESLLHAKKIWDKCDFFPSYNIGVLNTKSLIAIKDGHLWMHDLIRDMGREVVRQEASLNPGERSRLCFYKDVLKVLRENSGSSKIEGIMLDPPKEEQVQWCGTAFEKMNNLRILIVRNTCFTQKPKYLPKSLVVFEWEGYPSESLPLDFCLNDIVDLNLSRSPVILVKGMSFPKMEYLTRVKFSMCDHLTHFPDLSGVPNLSELMVRNCKNLVAVHDSVGFLPKLKRLEVTDCIKLQDIPQKMSLPALQYLQVYGTSIAFIPHIEKLTCEPLQISISRCPLIKEVPDSIADLMGLEIIKINSSESGGLSVGGLPSEIFMLRNLKLIDIYFGGVEVRESLRRLPKPPAANYSFSPLTSLSLFGCGLTDEDLHIILSCFPNLQDLRVRRNELVSLPVSIGSSNLRYLDVSDCINLEQIPELPKTLASTHAKGCPSLSSQAYNTLWRLDRKLKP